MPIRLSGIASNMDTDAIVKELMNAQSLKKTKIENKITKLQWTKDIWKDMNSKIYKFYTGPLSKLKTQGSFSTKNATSSNESKVTVKAGVSANTGSHNIKVNKLASAQYVTGDKIAGAVTGETKLKDLGFSVSGTSEVVIKINNAGTKTELYVNSATTLNDLTQACKNVGLNASFDENQKRLFISSKASGKDNTFEITSNVVSISSDRNEARNVLGYYNATTSGDTRFQMDQAIDMYVSLSAKTRTPEEEKLFEETKKKLDNYMISNTSDQLRENYDKNSNTITLPSGIKSADQIAKDIKDKNPDATAADLEPEIKSAVAAEKEKYVKFYLDEYQAGTPSTENLYSKNKSLLDGKLANAGTTPTVPPTSDLVGMNTIGIGEVTVESGVCKSTNTNASSISAANSEIVYNGATLENTSNQVTVNGLTFELHGITDASETVSITIANDVDAVYDMVRDFVKGYNDILQEMNKLYNATSSKGYNPLTDDEKSAMTDDQIEKWEQKIKDALLRRDDKLSGVISSMRNNMSGSVSVKGKSYSLSSFGIVTGAYTEKGILHIAGDPDDATYSGDTDKLKKALTENPEEVMQVLSTLASNLYYDIGDKMKSTTLSSALTIYNDKEMDKVESRYKKDLATLEKKLKEMENRYYKQFSAMETAMSKLNSQSSQLSSMLGL